MTRDLTTEQFHRILAAALVVAADPPVRFNKYGATSYVRRRAIVALRAALEDAGIDWQEFKRGGAPC
jgi:hypothetical protein